MTSFRRALLAIAAAGFLLGCVAGVFVMTSDWAREDRLVNMTFGPLIGWSFITAGLIAWWRRPENRFGSLMTAVGFTWFLGAVSTSDAPGLFIVGAMFGALPFGVLIHMLLAFPAGRVEGRWSRALVGLAYFDVALLAPVALLLTDTAEKGPDGAPHNPLLLTENPTPGEVLFGVYGLIAIFGLIAVAATLWRRHRAASPALRRVLGPLYLAGGATMALTALSFATDAASHGVAAVIEFVATIFLAMVPFAFLGGLLRTSLARAGAVSEVLTGTRDVREALASGVGDPSLELAYWLPERERYVDLHGQPVDLPEEGSGRAVTPIYRDGRCIAAIVHDAALREQQPLVQAAGDAAALALENERLEAELRARVEELEASRTRIVEVGLAERRRLERDLHDGAQQRLVALRLQLRLARDQAAKDPERAQRMLDGAMAELDSALEELRELARGIHPAVLADRGLEPALNALAGRAPLPVDVEEAPSERLPARVEAAAYFVVAEALTNVAKYAQATRASVAVERRNGHAVVEVRDDGVGGADPSRGTGLTGLKDRLAALDGRLEVDSPEGGGTVVRADIPCG